LAEILTDTGTDGVVLKASGLAADAVAEIADGVLDEAMAGHVAAGTLGKAVADVLEDTGTTLPADLVDIESKIDVIGVDTTTEIPASIAALDGKIDTIDNFIDTEVAAIKAKTDNLPASPAAVGSPMTLTVGERTAIANEVESQIIDDTDAEKVLKAITDKIASVNPSLDDLTLAGIASAVRTELTTELARIDAAISTRLATAGYTAPANADISTIKSKTDNLPASPAASGEYTSALSAIQADLDNPNQYKADVSGIPAAVWGHATRTLSSFGTLVSDIWSAATRTLSAFAFTVTGAKDASIDAIKAKTDLFTTGTSLTIASAVSGSTITAHRGDTLSAALENIGALTNYSKLWFTVKRDYDDADTAAVIQIEKTGGLLYLNGAVGTAGNGSLTINDEATGDVTIVLNASETAKLSPGNYQYDIQILRSAGTPVSTLTYGEFVVPADVTRATS